MANPYTLLQGGTNYSEHLSKRYDEALASRDRFNEQAKIQGEQWEKAATQNRDLLFKLVDFAPTAIKAGQMINAKLEERAVEKAKDKGWSDKAVGIIEQAKADEFDFKELQDEDNEVRKKLIETGLDTSVVDKLMKNGGAYNVKIKQYTAQQKAIHLPGELHNSPEFQGYLETISHLAPEAQRKLLKEYIQNKHIKADYSPKIYRRVLDKQVDSIVDHLTGKIAVKDIKVNETANKVQELGSYSDVFNNDDTSLPGKKFTENINNRVDSTPEFITVRGKKVPNPEYPLRHKLAVAAELEHIENLIDEGLLDHGQLAALTTGIMQHRGHVSKNNPDGNVEIKDGILNDQVLADLTSRLDRVLTARYEAQDAELKVQNTLKVHQGLQHIYNLKTYKEKIQAFDQLVTGLGGIDKQDSATQDLLKNTSRILRQGNLDESYREKLIGGDLTASDLNAIKDTNPALYNKYRPLFDITKRDAFTNMGKGLHNNVKVGAGWSVEKQLSGGALIVANHLENKANKLALEQLLRLPPEALDDNTILTIIGNAHKTVEAEFGASGGTVGDQIGDIVDSDEKAKHLYSYNSITGRFPNWDKEFLGVNTNIPAHQIGDNTRNLIATHGRDIVLTTVPEGSTDATYFFTKKELLQMAESGRISVRANTIANLLREEPTKFIRDQANLLEVDLQGLDQPANDYYNINPDPYITELLRSRGPAHLSPNQYKRMEDTKIRVNEKIKNASKIQEALKKSKEPVVEEQQQEKTPEEKAAAVEQLKAGTHPILQEPYGNLSNIKVEGQERSQLQARIEEELDLPPEERSLPSKYYEPFE